MDTNVDERTESMDTNKQEQPDATSGNDEPISVKKKVLNSTVSYFQNAKNPIPIEKLPISMALTRIFRNEDMKKRIDRARSILKDKGKEAYSEFKRTQLPAVTFSGEFSKRGNASVLVPSGVITLDFDHMDSLTDILLTSLKLDNNIIAAFKSPGGDGVKALMYAEGINNDTDHKRLFAAAEKYIKIKYSLDIDKSCKDISRLTFLSYDPDIFVNDNPEAFDVEKWYAMETEKKDQRSDSQRPTSSERSEETPTYTGKALYAWKIVLSACERIRKSLPGSQHEVRLKESRLVGGYLHHGLDEDHVLRVLEGAVEDSGAKDMRVSMKTIHDGIEYGKENPAEIPDPQPMTVMTVDDGSKNATVIRKPSNTNGHDGYDGYDGYFEGKLVKPLPPAPISAFHPAIRFCMNEISNAKNIPIEICVAGMLAFFATLIGRSCGIKIKENWVEHANLYIALVARSGVGKTPATNFIFKSIKNIERLYSEQYEEELKQYQSQYELWDETRRDKKTQREYSISKPEHPIRRELTFDDFTIEALSNSLKYNSKGIMIYRDELSGLFYECDKYSNKQGGTISKLTEAYDSRPWKINRVKAERNLYIPNATLSIYGTIQPGILNKIFKNNEIESGFTSRFIFINAFPSGPSLWTEKCEPSEVDKILNLLSDKMSLITPDPYPTEIQCTSDAKNAFIEFNNTISKLAWMGSADNEDSLLQKMKAKCLRICLILHISNQILSDRDIIDEISLETMNSAITIAYWIIEHTKVTWNMITDNSTLATGKEIRVAKAIVNLASSVNNEFLSTEAITEEVNKNQNPQFHLSSLAVGKIRKSLNIDDARLPTQRGWKITSSVIEHCKLLLEKPVTTVTTVIDKENQHLTYDGCNLSTVINRHIRHSDPFNMDDPFSY